MEMSWSDCVYNYMCQISDIMVTESVELMEFPFSIRLNNMHIIVSSMIVAKEDNMPVLDEMRSFISKVLRIPLSQVAIWSDRTVPSLYRDLRFYCNGHNEKLNPRLVVFLDKVSECMRTGRRVNPRDIIREAFGDDAVTVYESSLISPVPRVPFNPTMNPHYSPLNTLPLNPDDRLLNGTMIEDHSDEISDDRKLDLVDTVNIMRDLVRGAKDTAIRLTNDRFMWFSDSQNSFIQHFYCPEWENYYLHDYEVLKKRLLFLRNMIKTEDIRGCPLGDVNSLLDSVNVAIESVGIVLEECSRESTYEEIESVVEDLNYKRRLELYTTYTWYVCVAVVEYPNDQYGILTDVTHGTYSHVRSDFRSKVEKHPEVIKVVRCEAFGTYSNSDEAAEVQAFIKVDFSGSEESNASSDDIKELADNWFKHLMTNKVVNRMDGKMSDIVSTVKDITLETIRENDDY